MPQTPQTPQTPPRRQSTTSEPKLTPYDYLDYSEIDFQLKNIAADLQRELTDVSKILDQSTRNKCIWQVIPNKNFSENGTPNFYLNITCNGMNMAHLSIHMGHSLTKAGSTHIKYNNGITNQLLFNGKILISSKVHTHPYLEDCILNVLNSSDIFKYKLKYLKYKNKYLKLKKLLDILNNSN